MTPITLAYSPCPNDTFIFSAWTEGRIPGAPEVEVRLEDIDTLNRWAEEGKIDVVKVSFHALGYLRGRYRLLNSGGALGRGCGPLIVARDPIDPQSLGGRRIGIPGARTTAALLLRLFDPALDRLEVMPFDRIMPAVRDGSIDAGLIIHESRFTYPRYGLHALLDLGEWWEATAGHPIPLGGIAARADLGSERLAEIDGAIAASLQFAWKDPDLVWGSVRRHAQEMDDEVMRRHIDLYVNRFSLDYGDEGRAAIRHLFAIAERSGVLPNSREPLFRDEG